MKNTIAIIVIKIDRKLKILFPKYSFFVNQRIVIFFDII